MKYVHYIIIIGVVFAVSWWFESLDGWYVTPMGGVLAVIGFQRILERRFL